MDVAVEAANDSRMLVRGSIAGKGRQTRAAAGIGSSGQGFSDPEEFAWSTHARGEELVVAEPGEFRTGILSIRLPRVLLRQRSETLARISRVTTPANLAEIVFRVAPGAPARCAGVPFELGQVVLHAPGSS